MLDFYKEQGEKNILETFKVRQAQLREEEERLMTERQQMAHRGTVGAISTFSFGRLGGWWSGSGSSSSTPQVCVYVYSKLCVYVLILYVYICM